MYQSTPGAHGDSEYIICGVDYKRDEFIDNKLTNKLTNKHTDTQLHILVQK